MTEKDAKDLVDWLDQAEEETKATIAEHERIDPFYDGVLSFNDPDSSRIYQENAKGG